MSIPQFTQFLSRCCTFFLTHCTCQRPISMINFLSLLLFFFLQNCCSIIKQNHCVAVGLNDTLLASSANVTSLKMITLHTLSAIWMNNETITCPPVNKFNINPVWIKNLKLLIFSNRATGLEVLCALMESLGTLLRSLNEIVPARR